MDLKEFIELTLIQIVDGVQDANKKVTESGARISSKNVRPTKESQFFNFVESKLVNNIEFDVAVTTTENDNANGCAGIKIAGINIGGGIENQTSNQTVSRIKFNIPLQLPGN
jgi:hypothetical protein